MLHAAAPNPPIYRQMHIYKYVNLCQLKKEWRTRKKIKNEKLSPGFIPSSHSGAPWMLATRPLLLFSNSTDTARKHGAKQPTTSSSPTTQLRRKNITSLDVAVQFVSVPALCTLYGRVCVCVRNRERERERARRRQHKRCRSTDVVMAVLGLLSFSHSPSFVHPHSTDKHPQTDTHTLSSIHKHKFDYLYGGKGQRNLYEFLISYNAVFRALFNFFFIFMPLSVCFFRLSFDSILIYVCIFLLLCHCFFLLIYIVLVCNMYDVRACTNTVEIRFTEYRVPNTTKCHFVANIIPINH